MYDNRHRRLTKWAGNSVAVLLATYARCVDRQLPDLKRRLEAVGNLPDAHHAN